MSNALDLSLDFHRFSGFTTFPMLGGKVVDQRSHFGIIVRGGSILQYAHEYEIGSILIAQKLDVESGMRLVKGAHVVINTSPANYPNLSLRIFDSLNMHNASWVKTMPQNKTCQPCLSSSIIGAVVGIAKDKAVSFL